MAPHRPAGDLERGAGGDRALRVPSGLRPRRPLRGGPTVGHGGHRAPLPRNPGRPEGGGGDDPPGPAGAGRALRPGEPPRLPGRSGQGAALSCERVFAHEAADLAPPDVTVAVSLYAYELYVEEALES